MGNIQIVKSPALCNQFQTFFYIIYNLGRVGVDAGSDANAWYGSIFWKRF